eukprot:Protomagalhaensia_wolfi_Nauph_80__2900@NODE_298_length_2861_cov_180_339830_g222_i0_p1_GENE_NODE_298_length_2861_cov_180_339830_g222_i0NODE_298_length_2861_cov_180_339830_g222_i0_p1_ORF_typecomplete_len328_score42_79_NODE_298_length_2861_cov_180_339830_g222_i0501033
MMKSWLLGFGLVAAGTLLDISCDNSGCENVCLGCAESPILPSLEDCLGRLPRGCEARVTVSQRDAHPLYSCTRPGVGHAIALPFLTEEPAPALIIARLQHYRRCEATQISVSLWGGPISKQEMRTCALDVSPVTVLPAINAAEPVVYVDLSPALIQGHPSETPEFVQLLDPCAHELDKVLIALLIETGTVRGLGTGAIESGITVRGPFLCPAESLFAEQSGVCIRSISEEQEEEKEEKEEVEENVTDDTFEEMQSSEQVGEPPNTVVFLRLRQFFVLVVAGAMIYVSYLYYGAIKKELAKSQAAREIVRESFHDNERRAHLQKQGDS